MKKIILSISLVLLSCNVNFAQNRDILLGPVADYASYGVVRIPHQFTEEVIDQTPSITDLYATVSGDFEQSALFGKSESVPDHANCIGYRGVPYFFYVKKDDVIALSFDMDFDNMIYPYNDMKYLSYSRCLYFIVGDNEYVANLLVAKQPLFVSPDKNSIAFTNTELDGYFIHDIAALFDVGSAYNTNYTIWLRRFGKIASVKFNVDEGIDFDLSNSYNLFYNLLNHVHVSATDIYGQDVPILNSLVSQWQVDKETGIARFTPILYPFSCTIDGLDDSYETDATNKSASTEEDDNVPNAGTTLDNCMTLEAVNPNMLLLDLNKGGTVTNVAHVNASTNSQDVWYDMFGRKYITKPTAAGLYIHNGKKEVVK